MVGGGEVVSVAAFNEMKSSMAQLLSLAQLQANSVARLEREADVSKLKAERAKSDKDGKKAGIHTQMEILEEALYGLAECDRLVEKCVEGSGSAEKSFTPMNESSVESVHDRLKEVGTVLRRRLVALDIADGAATMQNGWRSVELWEEEKEASEGVTPSIDKKRKLYSDAAQSIETDNKRKKGSYGGGGGGGSWKNQSEQNQGSFANSWQPTAHTQMFPKAASAGFGMGRPIPPHKGGTAPCARCGQVGHWSKECHLNVPGQG